MYTLEELEANYQIEQVGKHSWTIHIPMDELDNFIYYEGPGMLWIFIQELGIVSITIAEVRRT